MKLTIVVPCYNEEPVLPETSKRLVALLERLIASEAIESESHVLYVDDGSRDRTWSIIEEHSQLMPHIRGIKLSRNRGHQNALIAGMFHAEGDVVISVDADLQDDLEAMVEMLAMHRKGIDVVYGVRSRRDTDTFMKRFTAEGYYRLLNRMGVEIIFNHADYRLLSRRVIESLRQYGENNLFIRAIVPQLGYPSATVYYDRAERFAGESKYPLRKMLAFAWEGITSFSAAPLRLITGIGFVVSLGSVLFAAWALGVKLFSDSTVPGWASTVIPIYLLGGVQLLAIGIIGEYLAKIYLETKHRPRYFIEKSTDNPLASSSRCLSETDHLLEGEMIE